MSFLYAFIFGTVASEVDRHIPIHEINFALLPVRLLLLLSNMPKNSKTLANRKGLPSAKPVIPAHIQSMKRTSKHCPALNQVIGVMEPGDCDASDIYDFTGCITNYSLAYDCVFKLVISRSDGEEVHALFECDYKLEAGTPVTVYGYLGLSDSSKLMLVVQILEFTDPSPSEPEYIDLT